MSTLTVTTYTANLRDVDGCDSDQAVEAIMAATRGMGDAWADENGHTLEWREEAGRDTQTFRVSGTTADEIGLDDDLVEMLGDWSDKAISDGDW